MGFAEINVFSEEDLVGAFFRSFLLLAFIHSPCPLDGRGRETPPYPFRRSVAHGFAGVSLFRRGERRDELLSATADSLDLEPLAGLLDGARQVAPLILMVHHLPALGSEGADVLLSRKESVVGGVGALLLGGRFPLLLARCHSSGRALGGCSCCCGWRFNSER